ncbi:MAG: outer membrane beta-barrel protein, partial [Nitrososphaera sp.]
MRIALILAFFFCAVGSYGSEVNGIWTESSTKDLGEWTGIAALKGLKIRGWLDSYYVSNFNDPHRSTVIANQGASIVKGRDVTIEGRTFDIHNRSFRFSLGEVELEKVPTLGEWAGFGFKLDVAVSPKRETQDIIVKTIQAGVAKKNVVNDFDRYIQHFTVGYLAPIGKGLRIDFGKFVTHIGGETIETIKNNNYSHSFFYTYAIPFQDTGFRINYPWTDTFYTEFYILQGWNVTNDNNSSKTVGPSIGWTPSPKFSVYANYLVGPEATKNNHDLRNLYDMQVNWNPFDPFNYTLNFDIGTDEALVGGNALWWGLTHTLRYKVNDYFEPALRLEYYADPDGFTTGVKQRLVGLTLTGNLKYPLGKGFNVIFRPEYRYDRSTNNFFTRSGNFRDAKSQHTLG